MWNVNNYHYSYRFYITLCFKLLFFFSKFAAKYVSKYTNFFTIGNRKQKNNSFGWICTKNEHFIRNFPFDFNYFFFFNRNQLQASKSALKGNRIVFKLKTILRLIEINTLSSVNCKYLDYNKTKINNK